MRTADVMLLANRGEIARAKHFAVIGEDASDSQSKGAVVGKRLPQKASGAVGTFGRPYLGEGNPRMVINGHIGVIEGNAARALLAVARDPMAHNTNATQALDVQVQQFAWRSPFVTLRQRQSRIAGRQPPPAARPKRLAPCAVDPSASLGHSCGCPLGPPGKN